MCGIACLVGTKDSPSYCYEALEKLEYRGYDSAGIAGLSKEGIKVCKKEGRVKNIQSFAKDFKSQVVISHTRWATHGKPSAVNAHPHVSLNGEFAVVHNGIIENYQEIKRQLEGNGEALISETDTECIVELIASLKGKGLERVKEATTKLKGSYALAVLDKKNKSIIGTRLKSPLYVAHTSQGEMLASDIICFSSVAKSYYSIKEGEFVVLSKKKIKIYDNNLKQIKPEFTQIKDICQDGQKNGYEYFMEKEINEIPGVIKKICSFYKSGDFLSNAARIFEGVDKINLIGCGTAYHACLYGAKVLQKALCLPCEAYLASEYKYSEPLVNDKTLGIFVSQSGETADTLGCASLMQSLGAKTLSITNVSHSALANMTDYSLPLFAGVEIAVASTKAYVAQVLVLYILAKYLRAQDYSFEEVEKLSESINSLMSIDEEIVDLIKERDKIFFIGRQFDSISALESALKLKEISYKSAEGYAAGELKHGTIALIEEGTPVIVFATDNNILEKTLSAAQEVRSRGAKVILVTSQESECFGYDYKIDLPAGYDSDMLSIIGIIPFQMLAFKVSLGLGYNPDKPRNLAKSVTVE